MMTENVRTSADHLQSDTWQKVNRLLVKKAISEFAHEKIINPILIKELEKGWAQYTLPTDSPEISYSFRAVIRALDHWHVDEQSIVRTIEKKEAAPDLCHFILEQRDTLGVPEDLLPTYLGEVTATLNSMAFKEYHESVSSNELVRADFQTIEHAMKEGHPCFLANSGRMGFDAEEYHQYAPEANQAFRLVWIAGHKSRTAFNCIHELSYEKLLEQELDTGSLTDFRNVLLSKKLDPEDYYFLPVHPWQWKNKISTLFVSDLANEFMVYLGEGAPLYSAQQSIRTLFNLTHPKKFYVKTALSILNMGFMRGLSPYYMGSTPGITEWINDLLGSDEVLKEAKFEILSEVATVGYRNLLYEPLGKKLPQNKMLSALWRESPMPLISDNQQLMTMAGMLHVDQFDSSLLIALIKASGISTKEWIGSYLNCYLKPLIHCFYQYELVFMPHGENVILVLENQVPVKAIMKDITEEVIVFNEQMKLEGHAARLQKMTSDEMKLTYIFTDVFDCFFRFLSNLLAVYGGCHEDVFWEQVATCILDYQREHPELESQYRRYDFFQPTFKRCCLNRLQLQNTKQMLDLDDPMGSLQWADVLQNPIANYTHQHN
ncbi:MAG: IucA/IucC family siderophore biosynthesis protein [Bacteroidota bacterium]